MNPISTAWIWPFRVKGANLCFSLFALLFSLSLNATTIIPFPNLGEMAQAADAVVVAKANENYEHRDGQTTYFRTQFTVMSSIKGELNESSSFDLQAWKTRQGDLTGIIWGDAEFREGSTYLIFLSKRDFEPGWAPMMLAYGIFEEKLVDDELVLVPSKESLEIDVKARPDGIPVEPMKVYSSKPMIKMLTEVTSGKGYWESSQIMASAEVNESALINRAPPSHCTYLNIGGNDTRYNNFPSDDLIIYSEDDGDNTFTPASAVHNEVSSGITDMEASYTGIDLNYSGTLNYEPTCATGSAQGGNFLDVIAQREGIVIYNDPCNQITDLNNCSGTLAIGGLYASGTHTFDNITWASGYNTYVIMNNDIGPSTPCLNVSEYRIVVIHELTHGLGGGHIAFGSGAANMNPSCCNSIQSLDEQCLNYTYAPLLPVELIDFKTTINQSNVVELKWSTASEINTEHFELQRTNYNGFFETIGKIGAKGNSTVRTEYSAIDDQPNYGKNYYRLKIVDEDGSVEYSPIRSIDNIRNEFTLINLYPNPANEAVNLRYHNPQEGNVQLKVTDLAGSIIESIDLTANEGENSFVLSLSEFKTGVYLVVIEDERGRQSSHKLFKN